MGDFVEKLLKAFAIPVAVGITCAPAQSRSLQILGTAGLGMGAQRHRHGKKSGRQQ